MTTIEALEGLMLVSFSVSWYWSIAKMFKTKVAAGKSLNFVLMICFGYMLGISSKLVAWREMGELSPLIGVYSWNLLVTAFDAMLVVRYSRIPPPPFPFPSPPPMASTLSSPPVKPIEPVAEQERPGVTPITGVPVM